MTSFLLLLLCRPSADRHSCGIVYLVHLAAVPTLLRYPFFSRRDSPASSPLRRSVSNSPGGESRLVPSLGRIRATGKPRPEVDTDTLQQPASQPARVTSRLVSSSLASDCFRNRSGCLCSYLNLSIAIPAARFFSFTCPASSFL